MKILYSNKSLYPFEGGGDISALTLLEHLSKKNDVSAYYIGKNYDKESKIIFYPQNIKQKKGMWLNLYFLDKKWEKVLSKAIEKEKPDLIICQDYFIGPSVRTAKKYGIKVIVFLRSYLHLSIDNCKSYLPSENKFSKSKDFIYQIQYPFYKNIVKKTQEALKKADLVCSVSEYVKEITQKYCNIDSEVIRPFISFNKIKKTGDCITYINPDLHKGVQIFEKIADKLSYKKFLVVGKENYKINKKNVVVSGYKKDINEIFAQTRLLIVPSIFPDPHPRVVVEAMALGIPSVVSGRGGLIEEVKESGIIIKNIFNINEWTDAIKKFDDKRFYNEMSKKAIKHSKYFEDKIQFKKFDNLLAKLFSKI